MNTRPRERAWTPAPIERKTLPIMAALRALQGGVASETQQALALDWIIYVAAGLNDPAFRSNQDGGERETSFALGRQHVAQQILKMINPDPKILEALRDGDGSRRDPDKAQRRARGGEPSDFTD